MIDAYFSKREVYRNRETLQLFDSVDCKAVCKKFEKTICLQIDGCLSGPSQRMHEARSQKLCFFFSKKMPKIDTLDALDDEMTSILNTL